MKVTGLADATAVCARRGAQPASATDTHTTMMAGYGAIRPTLQSFVMVESTPEVVVLEQRIDRAELTRLVARFEDMVKYVVDVERRTAAVGGEMQADAKAALLEAGSRQGDIWGANYYPGRGADGCIEYTSLINIRPAVGNRGMELLDPALRETVRTVTFALIGEGEPL